MCPNKAAGGVSFVITGSMCDMSSHDRFHVQHVPLMIDHSRINQAENGEATRPQACLLQAQSGQCKIWSLIVVDLNSDTYFLLAQDAATKTNQAFSKNQDPV